MSTLSTEYTLSREEAAEKLNVSVRTIDRYIRRNHFDAKKVNRHVLISKPSFERYFESREDLVATQTSQPHGELEASSDTIQVETPEPIPLSQHEHPQTSEETPHKIYKSLYEELKEKYDDQRKRLEGAHYRVGQLEAQVKSMVPMLEFKEERQKWLLASKAHEEELEVAKTQMSRLRGLFSDEKFNKNVFVGIVYALLATHVIFWLGMR